MRFLIVPTPYENESLVSFIGRVSIENKFDTAAWIFRELDLTDIRVTHFNPNNISLRKLNELTGIKETELWKLTLCNELNYAENNTMLNKILFSNGLVSLKVKICPLCLKEKKFCSKIWDIKIYTTCAIHSVELITSCPSCNKGIYHLRGNLYKCSCGLDYRDININNINNELNLQRSIMIHSKFDNNISISKNNKVKYLFSDLDISSIMLIYHIFYRIYFIYIIKKRRFQVPFIMNENNNNAINWIDKIFSYWPNNFLNFLHGIVLFLKILSIKVVC
ncbi:TniQ family protein [Bacillus sp. V33-4]|uniref:TniQ family protein n=1 Tax=Bacillus sp. V33-4 TaxID=2054169 RepID=UPI000C7821FD|nr:TniQ family protein [Bacillus sp. V33-4]PLR82557.1 hypothetical protein CVD23_16510 [Bacillus sp. V33-4]